MSDKRICVVCGSTYDYCPNCPRYDKLPRWKFNFDEENCMDIWSAVNDYRANTITKEQAIKILKSKDLSHLSTFNPKIKVQIEAIMKEADVKVEPEEPVKVEVKPVQTEAPAMAQKNDEHKNGKDRFKKYKK